jgi:hypothetical protein
MTILIIVAYIYCFYQRLKTKNPCFTHKSSDKVQGIFCLPYFYILGPQKCGTTDTFERSMRHPDVVRFNPKVGEQLEPHLWTNQLEEGVQGAKHKGPSGDMPLIFRNSLRQYGRHSKEILSERKIA